MKDAQEYPGRDGYRYRWVGDRHESFDGIDGDGNELWVESALPSEGAAKEHRAPSAQDEWQALPWYKRLFYWAVSGW